MTFINEVENFIQTHDLRTMLTVFFFILLWFLVDRIVTKSLKRLFSLAEDNLAVQEEKENNVIKQRVATYRIFVIQFVRVLLSIIILTIIMESIGISVKSLVAGIGMVGLGLSLAAQNLIRDYINGLTILIENQFNVGDWVEIGAYSGDVEGFTLRSTKIRDANGNLIFLPNGQIQSVKNCTKKMVFGGHKFIYSL